MRNKIIKLSPEIAVSKSKEYRNENKKSRLSKVAKKGREKNVADIGSTEPEIVKSRGKSPSQAVRQP